MTSIAKQQSAVEFDAAWFGRHAVQDPQVSESCEMDPMTVEHIEV